MLVRMSNQESLAPLLVVRGARQAIDFYVRALGARVLSCFEHGTERHISHADLTAHGATFSISEEARAWNSDSPHALAGSPVVLQLRVPDAEAAVARLLGAGATTVFPLCDLLGERMARVRDPFGHLWIVQQRLEDLSTDEIQRQRDALYASVAASSQSSTTLEHGPRYAQSPAAHGRLHLLLGPVGAGKSTFGLKLSEQIGGIRLTLDQWMVTLFSADRPLDGAMRWYVERAARSLEQIWAVACDVAARGVDVVLELGLLRRSDRLEFYGRVMDAGLPPDAAELDLVGERFHCQGNDVSGTGPEPPDAAR
jgi:PhnB protein